MSLEQRIQDLAPWYHTIDFGNGITTVEPNNRHQSDPAIRWRKFSSYIPDQLIGKTVLDVGCNSGFFSVQCKLRGAEKVLAVDAEPRHLLQARLLSDHFNAPIETTNDDIHHLVLKTNERFDYIIFSRLFYHLRYPTLIFDRLAEMAKEIMVFITEMVPNPNRFEVQEDYLADKKYDFFAKSNFPKMHYIETKLAGDSSNWWIPNESYVLAMIRSAGMEIVARPFHEVFALKPHAAIKAVSVAGGRFYFPNTSATAKQI
jgi:tRNA (mo5U34)-methyltransferase